MTSQRARILSLFFTTILPSSGMVSDIHQALNKYLLNKCIKNMGVVLLAVAKGNAQTPPFGILFLGTIFHLLKSSLPALHLREVCL